MIYMPSSFFIRSDLYHYNTVLNTTSRAIIPHPNPVGEVRYQAHVIFIVEGTSILVPSTINLQFNIHLTYCEKPCKSCIMKDKYTVRYGKIWLDKTWCILSRPVYQPAGVMTAV
jgi:hypothetical protein